jgi:hypothetical protein
VRFFFFLGGTFWPGVDGVDVEEDVDDWSGLVNDGKKRIKGGGTYRGRE